MVIKQFLAPAVLGRQLDAGSDAAGLMAKVRGNRMAKAAVENAVWDLEALQHQLGSLIPTAAKNFTSESSKTSSSVRTDIAGMAAGSAESSRETAIVNTGRWPARFSASMIAATSFDSSMASLIDWRSAFINPFVFLVMCCSSGAIPTQTSGAFQEPSEETHCFMILGDNPKSLKQSNVGY